ncbi:MAG: hypothetical protein R3247_15930 [Rhodothermales bacterium]|nr:hypothetical protein [Rhodothermales bacterium]
MAPEATAQWVEAPGRGWVQLTFFHHDTRSRFDAEGQRTDLFSDGARAVTTSAFLTGVVGLVRGADLRVQVPFHRLAFDDVAADRRSTGFGDPRIHLRVGPALAGRRWALPVALRGGVKLALGRFDRDAEIIPLSEGQRDWEIFAEVGRSLHPRPLYLMAWAGYRWRAFNDEIDRKPGDERLAFVAAGGTVRRLAWKLATEGLWGRPPRRRLGGGAELALPLDRRRLVQVLPSLGYPAGPGMLEVGLRLPVAGRNLPAGTAIFAGYFLRVDLRRGLF